MIAEVGAAERGATETDADRILGPLEFEVGFFHEASDLRGEDESMIPPIDLMTFIIPRLSSRIIRSSSHLTTR
jgi:hypothetical protein